jgi:hypothetical protein
MWARPLELPEQREPPEQRAVRAVQAPVRASRKTNPRAQVVAPGFAHQP